ncbi:urease accessory protein UreD [Neotabrizicola shimadae]|uniref:Urease accessory protein UreD n=1 Tax=Neotabrizicola shimadae TaxID=2807096 RepID=A0A8G0ZW56_9RHOB|nr:urease accessory protein UreD [Neotabrizicola shimadae]QYZ71584.1 urease accessory protein UreD [Neotabrizicola shimadae]
MNAHVDPFIRPAGRHQRAEGEANVSLRARPDGVIGLGRLRQQGSAKAISLLSGRTGEIVFLNTAGGLTSGDRLSYALQAAPGLSATATTQTAERAYRAPSGPAQMVVSHRVGQGARLDWLPQETILFDGASLERRTEIALEGDAACLMLEAVVMGRAAMGETLARVHLSDRRYILRDGAPVLVEPLRLETAALTAGPAVLDSARAFATLAFVAAGAEDALAPVRRVLDEPGTSGAASGWDGRLVVRLLAVDGWPLRRQILRLLAVLRPGPLPRVWQM